MSEISIDFDDDDADFGLGKSNDDQRFRSIDTRISSMDVQHDEEMKMIKRKNEILEQKKTARTDQEVSSLRSLVKSLLSSSSPGKPSASPSAEFSSLSFPLDDDENLERKHDNYAFDINDGTNDITTRDKNHDGYEGLTVHQETEEERLVRLEFDGDEKAYRAKG